MTEVSTAPAGVYRFAALSDSRRSDKGVNDAVLSLLVKHVKDESGAQLVVFPGDMVRGGGEFFSGIRGQLNHWKEVMAPLYSDPRLAGLKVYPGLGNHEAWGRGGARAFLKTFQELPRNGPKGSEGLTYSLTRPGSISSCSTRPAQARENPGGRLPLD